MNKNILKSIGAIIAGFIVGGVLSYATDFVLEGVGILPKGNLYVSTFLILVVLLYRSVYEAAGCYVIAKLAPNSPMKHALIGGAIGTVLSVMGAVATANMNIGPAWYAWTLAALSMPSAWVGGKVYEMNSKGRIH